MERLTEFMTPRTRQATVALADEGDDDRELLGRGALTEAVQSRGSTGAPPGHGKNNGNDPGLLGGRYIKRLARRGRLPLYLIMRRWCSPMKCYRVMYGTPVGSTSPASMLSASSFL